VINATLNIQKPYAAPGSPDILLVRLYERDKQQEWAAVVATKDQTTEDINAQIVKFVGAMLQKALTA
jgi:hypothetical protein